ncbi:MAG: histidine phosphatase family protein [Candidatus Lustribacter sp.]|jgi:hypothetical protein
MPGPKKIILIRHAEKPGEHPPPLGVDEEGAVNQHALLVRGWQRAGALVAFFVAPTHKKIATPKTIIAATVCDDPAVDPADAKSLRPVLTVEPLVAKLGAAVTFVNDIPVGQEDAAIAAIKACAGVVLVSWEHKRIPAIAAGFIKEPPEWGDRFDPVWILDRKRNGSYDLTIKYQDLLAGDLPYSGGASGAGEVAPG